MSTKKARSEINSDYIVCSVTVRARKNPGNQEHSRTDRPATLLDMKEPSERSGGRQQDRMDKEASASLLQSGR